VKDKLRVLWVTNAFGCGGAERQLLYMYNILKNNRNIEISVIYYAHVADELNLDGINVTYIDKKSVGKIATIRMIREYIKTHDIDIMHALGGCSANIYGRGGAMFTKAVSIGAVVGQHNFDALPVRIVNSILNLRGDWWTVNNEALVPILREKLALVRKKKIKLMRNGFVPADKIDYKQTEITEYDLDKGDNIVFSVVGRLHPVKNYGLFISAAHEVLKKHENVRFWIIGNGEEHEKLLKLAMEYGIEQYIKFWGYRTDIDVALNRTDVFVQTSFTEGSPNSIAEAMRAGKPVISTRSTDLSEMIHEGKNGYVVPVGDTDALAEGMKKMVSFSPDAREEMGKYSQKLFATYFLDEAVASAYTSFYTEVMQIRGGKK